MQNVIQKSGKRIRQKRGNNPKTDPVLLLKLYELIQGERDMVRVHSNALDSEICFVNPALYDPAALQMDCPVYTTRELAQVLSLSPEEFRRFQSAKKQRIEL
jgi:hypothetical protein